MFNTINSKIDAIKLVRAFSIHMGLKDSKLIVEAWERAFSNGFQCSDLRQICTLGSFVCMVESGEWNINEKDEIIIKKVIGTQDILNLRR